MNHGRREGEEDGHRVAQNPFQQLQDCEGDLRNQPKCPNADSGEG